MNWIIPYYLTIKNNILNSYRYVIVNTLGFSELRITNTSNKFLILRYLLFNTFTYIIKQLCYLRCLIDVKSTKIHITKVTENGNQSIIIDKENVSFEDLNYVIQQMNDNNKMFPRVFLNLELINGEQRICLKSLIVKYKDLDNQHNNTIENILEFNEIPHSEESKVYIKFFRETDRKFITSMVNLGDIKKEHVNYFIKL
jgi:hypothetical protein